MGESIERFPLFPLGLVLLPGEVVPLHVFEQRYRTMIAECLESESEFGIVWLGDEVLHDVGCTAEITQVMEEMDDGRMNIIVQGVTPFRLERRVDDMDYPAGDVVLLDEEEFADGGEASTAARLGYADLVERVTDSRPAESDLAELDAYGMASTIAFENDAKQELLELRSESERLSRLATLCVRALERYDYAEQAAERASSNGKVHH
ncbi:MAG: LON peptidase substrate-binding domain-containing protein [Thermoleophilaceae bacterium]|nr:LON peptidase substrate-binding domain-containing protein [Thermoleophilaceae bacterium]